MDYDVFLVGISSFHLYVQNLFAQCPSLKTDANFHILWCLLSTNPVIGGIQCQ